MANLRSPRFHFLSALQFLLLLQLRTKVLCYQYKVGDLDAWGIPTSGNPLVYAKWSKYHTFGIGYSLMFLYPSQDSVIQVIEQSYSSCNVTDPILYMNNGNSLFNITSEGNFYFTSGEPGHCQKKQTLHITVGNVSADSPYGPSAFPEIAPSYTNALGSIPHPPSAATALSFCVTKIAVIGLSACAIISGMM